MGDIESSEGGSENEEEEEQRVFAFTALERVGGIMVYDITKVEESQFMQYFNDRDFGVEFEKDTRPPEEAGDTAPEQLRYIEEDVYGVPLLFATFSESSSISIYTVDCSQ